MSVTKPLFAKIINKAYTNMKHFRFLFSFIALALLVLLNDCSKDKENELKPSFTSSDIIMGSHFVEPSMRWLINGQTLQITIHELDYTPSVEGVTLTSIRVEKDGQTLLITPFKLESPIAINIDGWKHGENTLKLFAVFKSDNIEVEKEIGNYDFIVFNELPKYDVEGRISHEIKWLASNGEKFYKYLDVESEEHVFYFPQIKWIASNGEVFIFQLKDIDPYFFINQEATNFDAQIIKEERHWFTQDGPSSLPTSEKLGDDVLLYVNFTVVGEHEGIHIEQNPMIGFRILKEVTE